MLNCGNHNIVEHGWYGTKCENDSYSGITLYLGDIKVLSTQIHGNEYLDFDNSNSFDFNADGGICR